MLSPLLYAFEMIPAPIPSNQNQRLEALSKYQILDTAPEESYDHIVSLASFICDAPIALISFVDDTRQWFKSKVGLAVSETELNLAFCAHTIYQGSMMVVEDATKDDRFSWSPLVTGSPNIRFYAGAPLVNPEGYGLGSLCVIDQVPRKLSDKQREALHSLSELVVTQLELRNATREIEKRAALVKEIAAHLPICAHCRSAQGEDSAWRSVENFVLENRQVSLESRVCPSCLTEQPAP